MGGMLALEWTTMFNKKYVRNLVALATSADIQLCAYHGLKHKDNPFIQIQNIQMDSIHWMILQLQVYQLQEWQLY